MFESASGGAAGGVAGEPPLSVADSRRAGALASLAAIEQGPVSSDAAARLLAIDGSRLDRAGQLRLAAQLQRLEHAVAGRKLAAVAAFAGDAPVDDCQASRPDFADCEVAVALGMSQPAAQHLVSVARRLCTHLPRTLTAMCAGRVGYLGALRIVEGSADLTPGQCRSLEQRVLPTAPGKAPGVVGRAVRRTVARIDADALRRKQRRAVRESFLDVSVDDGSDSGAGHVSGRGPHVETAVVRAAVDAWARARKAEGDHRTLDQLRWGALVDWSRKYLGGDGGPRPTRHGSPVVVTIATDLTTFLGLTNHPMEILGTGAMIPAAALPDLIPDAGLRRLITDPQTGYLLDASPRIYRPSAALARFITLRHVTSSGPNSSVPATDTDLDHVRDHRSGGPTIRENLHPPNRRWHNAKTLGGWTVTQNADRTWTWVSPYGQTHRTTPHDYRLGP